MEPFSIIHNLATITATASTVINVGSTAVALIVNIKSSPTGTNPTLTFKLEEVDPVDQSTVTGLTTTGITLNAIGNQTLTIGQISSGYIKVTWTIGGTSSPTFTNVNATLVPQEPTGTQTKHLIGSYCASTNLVTGSGSAQNIASIENPTASVKTVIIKRLTLGGVVNAVSSTAFLYKVGRTTGVPSSGTTLTIQKRDSNDPTASAIVRSGPTATAAGGSIWVGSPGIVLGTGILGNGAAIAGTNPYFTTLDSTLEINDIILAPGEGLLFTADANSTSWVHFSTFWWQEVSR